MNITKRRILITGGSGDIGAAVISLFSQEDSLIGIQYFEHPPDYQQEKFPHISLFQADLSHPPNAGTLVENFARHAGGIDVLIQLSGGLHRPVSWREMTEEDFQYDLNLNLVSVFFLVQAAVPYLEKGNCPRIVLTGTASAAHGGGTTSLAYGIAKAGIECLTKRLAKDCARSGILTNAIAPGFIDTRFHTLRKKLDPRQFEERAGFVPLKRPGKPIDVARVIKLLASPDNGYINGAVIDISGGDFI